MALVKLTSLIGLLLVVVGSNDTALILPQKSIPNDTFITLERSGCYGTFPIYKLAISADGTVTFEGRQFVKVKGIVKGNISLEKLRQLIAQFDKAKYFSLHDKYETAKDGCPDIWTDMPTAITSIRINRRVKSISHYHGCQIDPGQSPYPKRLTVLENQIDDIVGTQQWIR